MYLGPYSPSNPDPSPKNPYLRAVERICSHVGDHHHHYKYLTVVDTERSPGNGNNINDHILTDCHRSVKAEAQNKHAGQAGSE